MTADFGARRRAIGNGLWLYGLLDLDAAPATPGDRWMLVADGRVIRDSQLALLLHVSVGTIRRWRLALERFGYIHSERGRGGRVYHVVARWRKGQPEETPEPEATPVPGTGAYLQ